MKDASAKLKDDRKCNGNSDDNQNHVEMRDGNCPSQKDAPSAENNHLFSSQNGYGGRGKRANRCAVRNCAWNLSLTDSLFSSAYVERRTKLLEPRNRTREERGQ